MTMELAITRRALLQSLSLVGLSACTVGGTDAGSAAWKQTDGSVVTSGLAGSWTTSSIHRRLERATFGLTDELVAGIKDRDDLERWLDAQLSLTGVENPPEVAKVLDGIESALPPLTQARFETPEERSDLRRRSMQTSSVFMSITKTEAES